MEVFPNEETISNEINFFSEEIDFVLSDESIIFKWILNTIQTENKNLQSVNYIFCSDVYLHKLNVEYLDHDTLTDVISFQNEIDPIEGDIFISIDRVKANAEELKQSFLRELHRVIIHGILHFCGYKDKTDEEARIMRVKEEFYLGELDVE